MLAKTIALFPVLMTLMLFAFDSQAFAEDLSEPETGEEGSEFEDDGDYDGEDEEEDFEEDLGEDEVSEEDSEDTEQEMEEANEEIGKNTSDDTISDSSEYTDGDEDDSVVQMRKICHRSCNGLPDGLSGTNWLLLLLALVFTSALSRRKNMS